MKKITILSIILLSLVLAACSSSGNEGPTFRPYVGGTEGVRMEFIEGLPPSQEGSILDAGRSEFGVGVKLTNAGEADIAPGDLTLELRGVLPAQYGKTNADFMLDLDEELPGATKAFDGTVIEGLFTTMTFEGLSYQPDARGDVANVNLQIAACYEYKTESTTPVCISGDTTAATTDPDDREICAISGIKNTQNSGGPVQITDFKQLPQGKNKVSIVFTITHVGQGDVYRMDTVGTDAACDDSLGNPDRNVVKVAVSLSDESAAAGTQVDCTGGFIGIGKETIGDITLFEGNPRTITCTIQTDPSTNIYEDLLNIDLSYSYGQEMEKGIVIKDAGTEE